MVKNLSIEKSFKFNAFCPLLKKKIDFRVDYEYFNLVGDTSTHSTEMGFDCIHLKECGLEDTINCPLFHKAPEGIN